MLWQARLVAGREAVVMKGSVSKTRHAMLRYRDSVLSDWLEVA